MAASHYTDDVSVYSLDGSSQLAFWKGASIEVAQDFGDVRPLSRTHLSPQPVKKSVTVSTSLLSTVSAPVKVSNLNVTAFSAGGTSFLAKLRGGSFSVSYNHAESSGVGDYWKFPEIVSWGFSMTAQFKVGTANASSVSGVMAPLMFGSNGGATVANSKMTMIVTINSVTFELPMYMERASHQFTDGDVQVWEGTWQGSGLDSGTYPTTPTGSSDLLAKCINAPRTPVVILLTSHSSEGIVYGTTSYNSFIPSSVTFSWNDGQIIATDYTFISQGAVHGVAN